MRLYTKASCESLSKFDRSVSWLGWAYNEERLIEDYLVKANALLGKTVEDYEIIIVDDCSTDRTNEVVCGLMKDIPQIRLIRNPVNMNVGYSSRMAIMSAKKEYLFWQTVDWSYDIAYLRLFLELLKSYDIVAGVRIAPVPAADKIMRPFIGMFRLLGIKHITRRSDTISKAFVSVCNYVLIRSLFNVGLSDYQNVVFYPTKWIQSLDLEAISSFANPEALIKSHWRGASIVEVPISFIPRQNGEAKGTRPKAMIHSVKDIFRLWFKWIVMNRRGLPARGPIRRLNVDEWDMDRLESERYGSRRTYHAP